MPATAWWDVHCTDCSRWVEAHGSGVKKDCEEAARRDGWLVTRDENLCPDCREEAGR